MIKPMLAKVFDPKWLEDEFYLQPKLDGHRAVWDGSRLWSRTGKEIKSVPHILSELKIFFEGFPLDGELYSEEVKFDEISSVVRKSVNIETNDKILHKIKYFVYDHPVEKLKFKDRWYICVKKILSFHNKVDFIKYLKTTINTSSFYTDRANKDSYNMYGDKYEGTMIRNASGLYKFGKRSKDLMKIKDMLDLEAKVVGVTQKKSFEKVIVPAGTPGSKEYSDGTWYKNGEETLEPEIGALVCDLKGIKFEVGTGFSDELRAKYWKTPPIGKLVTIKYQEKTKDGIPRFPSFLRIREDI